MSSIATTKTLRTVCSCLVLAAASITLTGCSETMKDFTSRPLFLDQDVNLPQKNHAAADLLISQAQSNLTNQTPIAVAPLNELLQPEISSAFGAVITEQVGVRMSQLGYNVQLDYVTGYTDLQAATPEKPEIILTGNYNPRRRDVAISLRMADLQSKRIIASFDYTVPRTREVEEMIKPQPRVFRLSR